jgi:RimJ/RimL family protein N-acetyltransferase
VSASTPLSGLHAAALPERVTLEGRYCRLEPVRPQHAEDLFEATTDDDGSRYRWLLSEPPVSVAEMRQRIEAAMQKSDPLTFAVIDRASGRALGQQTLMRIEPKDGVIEIGGVLWGRGAARTRLATEALYLFAHYVFDDLGYRRFEWKCNNGNEASKRAAQRFGFTHEGIFRQHMIVKGQNRDTAWFSMLDGEWPEMRKRFETWLEPANFDAEGRQVRKLGQ